MKRVLLPTKAFERSAKRFLSKNPEHAQDLQAALECLGEDAFAASLKNHNHKGSEAILLEAVGSHNEVY